MKFKAFKKIGQFKDAIKTIRLQAQYVGEDEEGRPIYDEGKLLPTVVFKGTCKLHGTNSAITYSRSTGCVGKQKRSSALGGNSGHFGFVEYVNCYEGFFKEACESACKKAGVDEIIIFGEWCGQGVQKKVAISELTKRFVVFEAWSPEKERYLNPSCLDEFRDHSKKCYNIRDYKQYEIEIDTRYPQIAVDKINKLVDEVEKACPVSKAMLEEEHPDKCVDREEYLGEGIVFQCGDIFFKSKGDRHSAGGGGKKATVDPIKAQNVKEFIDKVVTEDRLEQCWGVIESEHGKGNVTTKQIGDLMRWIFNDIMEEEGDALVHNDLCKKDVSGAIANTARPWFIRKINSSY